MSHDGNFSINMPVVSQTRYLSQSGTFRRLKKSQDPPTFTEITRLIDTSSGRPRTFSCTRNLVCPPLRKKLSNAFLKSVCVCVCVHGDVVFMCTERPCEETIIRHSVLQRCILSNTTHQFCYRSMFTDLDFRNAGLFFISCSSH